MIKANLYLETIRHFFEDRIFTKYKDIFFIDEKRNDINVVEIHDKDDLRIKSTFIFWGDSQRVTILIEDHEIIDEEFITTDDLLNLVDCLISNGIVKTEKFVSGKLMSCQYEFSVIIDGEQKRIKDESKSQFSLFSWFCTPETKYTNFLPW